MIEFIFTQNSKKAFLKLEKPDQIRVIKKLKYLKNFKNLPPNTIRQILDMAPITHRLRVGKLRLLLHLSDQKGKNYKFIVTQIGHRRNLPLSLTAGLASFNIEITSGCRLVG